MEDKPKRPFLGWSNRVYELLPIKLANLAELFLRAITMAGIGSGWFERRSTKMRTDEYPFIDVRKLECKSGLDGYVILAGGALAELEWRPCHFGGYRPYFQCPRCKGRCCMLYRYKTDGKSTAHYGCQKCLGMVHPVENEGKLERAMRRNNKALARQGYEPMRPQGKPLWMRWPTWRHLSDQVAQSIMVRFEYHEKVMALLAFLDQKNNQCKGRK